MLAIWLDRPAPPEDGLDRPAGIKPAVAVVLPGGQLQLAEVAARPAAGPAALPGAPAPPASLPVLPPGAPVPLKTAARLHGSDDRNLRFEELVKFWLQSIQGGVKPATYKRRVVCINQLMPFFKTIPMRSITSADIEKWKLRRGASIAARTFNKELETLNHVIRYARDVKGILLDNPAEKVRNRKTAAATIEIPSKEQFGRLLAELGNEPQAVRSGAAAFSEFLAYSGLRLGEGREVRWRDVNFELNTVLVTGGETGTKNHQHRTIPLFPGLRRLLESKINEAVNGLKRTAFSKSEIFGKRLGQRVDEPGCQGTDITR